ncbi:MAG: hypothetical protein COB02_16775 [Candidatus Cloacimonadota bacterium]|nr:MAG: hypothetical protein COB02_16775 [Candidatus Cloacimonadota bacterium]
MKNLFYLSLLFLIAVSVSSASGSRQKLVEKYPFLKSRNIIRGVRTSYSILEEFYGEYYIPHRERKSHKKAPPFTPHVMKGDMKSCKDCHTLKNYKQPKFAGIRIPFIPKLVPSGSKHPDAKGSCRMCHVNQQGKHKIQDFYLDDVYPRIYNPKR